MVIQAQNFAQKVISEMRSRYEEVEVTEDRMVISDKKLVFKEIVDLLHTSRVTVSSAYMKEPTLDDVFLHITGKELRE